MYGYKNTTSTGDIGLNFQVMLLKVLGANPENFKALAIVEVYIFYINILKLVIDNSKAVCFENLKFMTKLMYRAVYYT